MPPPPASGISRPAPRSRLTLGPAALVALAFAVTSCGKEPAPVAPQLTELPAGLGYANQRVKEVPWSIHVVRVDRRDPAFEVHSVHALGGALGLSTLSQQLKQITPALGAPVAGVNGDFYQRDRAYAGDPRGLQIVDGELLSAPVGGVAFWTDAAGQPHTTNITSRFQVTWPDGTATRFGLNEERQSDEAVLYTPAIGATTRTASGRELVLEPATEAAWLPLRPDTELAARIGEIREKGGTALQRDRMVLSLGPALAKKLPKVAPGTVVKLSTATTPGLRGARTALSGGPVLVREGKPLKIRPANDDSYVFSTMTERHPRSALGWDGRYFYLVTVDGRQELSDGMTLEELGNYLAKLGCTDAMNLDGGGSATLWAEGKVRNRPCDGRERPIANALVVLRRAAPPTGTAK